MVKQRSPKPSDVGSNPIPLAFDKVTWKSSSRIVNTMIFEWFIPLRNMLKENRKWGVV